MTVEIQAPAAGATPTPTATATPTATPTVYTETDSITKIQSFAEASPNSATAPLALLAARPSKKVTSLLEIFFCLYREHVRKMST